MLLSSTVIATGILNYRRRSLIKTRGNFGDRVKPERLKELGRLFLFSDKWQRKQAPIPLVRLMIHVQSWNMEFCGGDTYTVLSRLIYFGDTLSGGELGARSIRTLNEN